MEKHPPAADKHYKCWSWSSINMSFSARAAFGRVKTERCFQSQSFILPSLWPYEPRQNYCSSLHQLLSPGQKPQYQTQTEDTQQGDSRKAGGGATEGSNHHFITRFKREAKGENTLYLLIKLDVTFFIRETLRWSCREKRKSYLRILDEPLHEGAVVGVLSANVAELAPVARERAVHAGEAAGTQTVWALFIQKQKAKHLFSFSQLCLQCHFEINTIRYIRA